MFPYLHEWLERQQNSQIIIFAKGSRAMWNFLWAVQYWCGCQRLYIKDGCSHCDITYCLWRFTVTTIYKGRRIADTLQSIWVSLLQRLRLVCDAFMSHTDFMLLWLYKSKTPKYPNHFVVQPHLCRNQPVWNHFKSNEFTSCRSHAAVPNHCFHYCDGCTKHTLLYPACWR